MTRPYSKREDPAAFKTREFLPPLKVPHGPPPAVRSYNYWCCNVRWTRRNWWRFRRACYAQGKSGSEMLREYMTRVIKDYEG